MAINQSEPQQTAKRAVGWREFLIFTALLLTGTLIAGCDESSSSNDLGSSTTTQLSGKLDVTGSSTVAPLVLEIAKRFEANHPDTRIDVQTGGSSRGIADVMRGTADVGMASRDLTAEESASLVAFPIAQDGVGLIVHADNPIDQLTDEQIKRIYTGEITNWKQLGGDDVEVTVVHKADGRATQIVFLEYLQLQPNLIDADIIIGDNEQGIKTVATNPGAIGYVSIGTAEFSVGDGVPIRLLPVAGVDATTMNVAMGVFPIGRPLLLLTKNDSNELKQAFIAFAQSEEVADLVRDLYFVPPQTEMIGINDTNSDRIGN